MMSRFERNRRFPYLSDFVAEWRHCRRSTVSIGDRLRHWRACPNLACCLAKQRMRSRLAQQLVVASARSSTGSTGSEVMADNIIKHLEAVRAFISQLQPGSGPADEVLKAQRRVLQLMLARTELNMVDANRIMAGVRALPLSEATTAELVAAITARCCGAEASRDVRARLQDFLAVPDYLSEDTWAILQDVRVPPDAKLDNFLQQCAALEMRCPNESSWQMVTALYLAVAEGVSKAISLSGAAKYATLQMVKNDSEPSPSTWPPTRWSSRCRRIQGTFVANTAGCARSSSRGVRRWRRRWTVAGSRLLGRRCRFALRRNS